MPAYLRHLAKGGTTALIHVFQVLHSSAGAGKTHALVKHYLKLALATDDETAYSRILALTFTNKAAGEMRERVLRYLEELAGTGDLSAALADVRASLIDNGVPEGSVRARAGRTLTHMLHHWPRLAVSTIDAFTRRVVMPFARDLRLDSELRMTTEEQDYRDMAVDRLLEEAGTEGDLTELLLAICEDLVESERDWRADKPLRALTSQLTKEQAITHLEQLREIGNDRFLAIRQRLRAETTAFRNRLRALGSTALEAIAKAGLNDEDLYFGKTGPVAHFRALASFEDQLEEKKNTLKALEKDKWASDKASASTKAAVEMLAPLFRETIGAVEELRSSGELDRHTLCCAILRDGRFPLVTSLHTTLAQWLGSHPAQAGDAGYMRRFGRPVLALEREMIAHADGIHANSEAIIAAIEADHGIAIDRARTAVIPHGMEDIAHGVTPAPRQGDTIEILFVGRLEERKGIDVLLAAGELVLPQAAEARFVIVGDDSLPGPDGVTCGQIRARAGAWLADLADVLFRRQYHPAGVRWVDIPKPNRPDATRRIGILTVRDRVVQTALRQVLEPVLEPTFLPTSFGFRPGRSVAGAGLEACR